MEDLFPWTLSCAFRNLISKTELTTKKNKLNGAPSPVFAYLLCFFSLEKPRLGSVLHGAPFLFGFALAFMSAMLGIEPSSLCLQGACGMTEPPWQMDSVFTHTQICYAITTGLGGGTPA